MVIYLDALILENIIVNFFLLYITCQAVRINVKFKYILLSAAFGGIYVITLVYPSLKVLTMLPFKLLVPVIMVLILFRSKNILLTFKAAAIYVLFSMLLAGLCVFIQYNGSSEFNMSSVIYNFSYKSLLLCIMIIYMLIHRLIIFVRDRKSLSSLIYNVDIVINDSVKTVKAFLDTGNELREPATNLPVMIVEKNLLGNLAIKSNNKFYIPFKVVNGNYGTLEGIKPDFIKVYQGDEALVREVIIGLCDTKLSILNDYCALLSRGIL